MPSDFVSNEEIIQVARRKLHQGTWDYLVGGVQRGSDVLKAVALGAKAVAIGKLQGWGLAADGAAGVVRVLEILDKHAGGQDSVVHLIWGHPKIAVII